MSDAQLATALRAKIGADPILSRYGLLVACDNGVVTLTGSVSSDADKTKAAALAAQLNSVKQVNISGIVVNEPGATAGAASGENSSASETVSVNEAKSSVAQASNGDIRGVDFRNFGYLSAYCGTNDSAGNMRPIHVSGGLSPPPGPAIP